MDDDVGLYPNFSNGKWVPQAAIVKCQLVNIYDRHQDHAGPNEPSYELQVLFTLVSVTEILSEPEGISEIVAPERSTG